MRANEFIIEGASNILYHYTSTHMMRGSTLVLADPLS